MTISVGTDHAAPAARALGPFRALFHLGAALLGLFILIGTIPHETPWDMTNLMRTVIDHQLVFRFTIPLTNASIAASTSGMFLGMAVLIALVFLSLPKGILRRTWRSLSAHPGAVTGAALAVYGFLITMIPSEPSFVSKGPAVVLYLVFSSLGLLLMLFGSLPWWHFLAEQKPVSGILEAGYLGAKRLLMDSPSLGFVTTLVLLEFILTNILSLVLFQHIPHIQDSVAQLFHGMIFSHGVLVAPAPPLPDFFQAIHVIIQDGKWYSQYPPGHSFLLMLGVLIGAPWVIDPLFGALTVGAMYFLGKELHGEVVGRLSALLTLLSPFVLFMSSEFMNHTTAMFFAVCFVLFFAKTLRTHRVLHGVLAGAALGYYITIRPYSGAALALPFFLYAIFLLRREFPKLWKTASAFVLTLSFFGGLLLLFNTLTNGSPFLFGFQVLWGAKVNPGFGHAAWGQVHTPMHGFLQTLSNFNGVNKYLFELPVPSLLFVALLFFTGKRNKWNLMFLGAFFSVTFAYFLYWFQDWCFGPRFLFDAALFLIVLTAVSIEQLPTLFKSVLGAKSSHHTVRMASSWMLVLLFVLGFATNIPPHLEFYGNSYWGVNRDVLQAVEQKQLQKAIVFVQGNFSRGFIGDKPFLNQSVIYVRDLGENNILMMRHYPDYQYFLASGSDLTPLSPQKYEQNSAGGSGQSTSQGQQEPSHRPSR